MCKVMHIGHKCNTSYKMLDSGGIKRLEEVTEEKPYVTSFETKYPVHKGSK